VRAIAKKYRSQYEQLVAETKTKADAVAETGASDQAKIQTMEASIAEMQTRLAEAEVKASDAEAEVQRLQGAVAEATKQVQLATFLTSFI